MSSTLTVDLYIDPDLPCLEGHFLNNPVVPAYILIGWAIERAAEIFKRKIFITAMKNLKFLQIVKPSDSLLLSIEPFDDKCFRFVYSSSEWIIIAKGEISFDYL